MVGKSFRGEARVLNRARYCRHSERGVTRGLIFNCRFFKRLALRLAINPEAIASRGLRGDANEYEKQSDRHLDRSS